MKLEVEGGVTKENPTMEEIATALVSMDTEEGSFAILGRNKLSYMQLSGSVKSGFSLEYQDGSLKTHYCCSRSFSLQEAIDVFQSYAKGGTQWQVAHNWELMTIPAKVNMHLEKPKIDRSPLALLIYALVALCFFAVFCGSRKGADKRVWLSVFFVSAAAFVAVGTTQGLRAGSFRKSFYVITRSESPFQFWFSVICGYSFSITLLLGIMLFVWKL